MLERYRAYCALFRKRVVEEIENFYLRCRVGLKRPVSQLLGMNISLPGRRNAFGKAKVSPGTAFNLNKKVCTCIEEVVRKSESVKNIWHFPFVLWGASFECL